MAKNYRGSQEPRRWGGASSGTENESADLWAQDILAGSQNRKRLKTSLSSKDSLNLYPVGFYSLTYILPLLLTQSSIVDLFLFNLIFLVCS